VLLYVDRSMSKQRYFLDLVVKILIVTD